MGIETIRRHLVNNKKIFWNFLRCSNNYAICEVSKNALFKGCMVKNNGKNNRIVLEDGARVCYCTFSLNGDNNTVIVKRNAVINGCVFFADDDANEIQIGEKSTFTGKTELIVTEGTKIIIGNDCMFAYGIVLRTGDHHSIFNNQRMRVNLSKSIRLGNHVWVGQNAYLLKGVEIKDGCVIGACSVVTKGTMEENSIMVGNPAKVIRTEIVWDRERI